MTIAPRRHRRFLSAGQFFFAGAMLSGWCWAQSSATISIDNGIRISVSASVGAPAETEQLKIEMFRASGDSFYRIFRDQSGLATFAYELELGRAAAENQFRVTAQPVEEAFAARFPAADGGKPTPTLSMAKEFLVDASDPAQIGLFNLEGQGLSVTDTVRVTVEPPGSAEPAGGAAGAPASLLRLSGLRISINGMPLKAEFGAAVMGRYALLYLPGRGAYFISASPVTIQGFIKAGSVDRNHMRFTVDNEIFECTADFAILTGADSGELWVYHDPHYAPTGTWTALPSAPAQNQADRPFTAAADSLQWWLMSQ